MLTIMWTVKELMNISCEITISFPAAQFTMTNMFAQPNAVLCRNVC